MAHTLNEQVVVIPSGAAADNIERYLSTIVSLTGWTRDGYTVYSDPGKTMGIKFDYTGSNTCYTEVFCSNNVRMNYISSFGIAAGTTIRVHKSTDETLTYLDIGTNGQYELRMISTRNENGDSLLIDADTGTVIKVGTTTRTGYVDIYMPRYTTGKEYCITKFPDPVNGKLIPSLYAAFGTAAPSYNNQLVSFDGEIFRLAFMSTDMHGPVLAFPVSDETEDE